MNSDELLSLAAKVEAAEGPSRALFESAAAQLALRGFWPATDDEAGRNMVSRFYALLNAGAYLDAALTLVPEGWAVENWQLWPGQPSSLSLLETLKGADGQYWHSRGDGHARISAQAATPALALCAAALRARAQDNGGDQ